MSGFKVQSIVKVAALSSVLLIWGCSDDDEPSGELSNFTAFSQTLAPVLDDFTCQTCHVTNGIAGDSNFADSDLRTAYDYIIGTNGFINLGTPDSSSLGTFLIANPQHNCNDNCAGIAQTFFDQISAWAGSVNARFSSGVTPQADFDAYSATVNEVVVQTCGGAVCHSNITPAFVSDNTLETYNEVIERGFVDLNNPQESTLVTLLTVDEHNCFSACETAGAAMQTAITAWSVAINANSTSVEDSEIVE